MTGYASFTAKQSGVDFKVEESGISKKGLVAYVSLMSVNEDVSEWLNLEEAELVHSALGTLIEEYKARQPTNVQLIESFPVGTRFTVKSDNSDNDPALWVRTYRGISGEVEDHVPVNEGILGFWNSLIVKKIEENN